MKRFSVKYTLLTYRLDQLWFPLAFWAFFVILTLLLNDQELNFNIARAYIGVAVPLIGGFMAAYAILDDPAIELRFATPIRAAQILFERTLLIFLIQGVCALAFILFALFIGVDFSALGDSLNLQLSWIVPTISMIALGTFGAILGAQTMIGSFLVGLVWIIEVIIRDAMAVNNWKYAYIFMGILNPEHPDLVSNQLALFAASAAFLFFTWLLLHKQERYI
ncbi:MAG: hypothetical protein JNM02_09515 [Anaerolineales bacterium]|nr:hypothetical protein [Anaerolineales bacterium]